MQIKQKIAIRVDTALPFLPPKADFQMTEGNNNSVTHKPHMVYYNHSHEWHHGGFCSSW